MLAKTAVNSTNCIIGKKITHYTLLNCITYLHERKLQNLKRNNWIGLTAANSHGHNFN